MPPGRVDMHANMRYQSRGVCGTHIVVPRRSLVMTSNASPPFFSSSPSKLSSVAPGPCEPQDFACGVFLPVLEPTPLPHLFPQKDSSADGPGVWCPFHLELLSPDLACHVLR
jgi:hypothetical protein